MFYVGELSWSWILKKISRFKKSKRESSSYVHLSIKREIRHAILVVVRPVWNTSMEFHGNLWKSMEIHGIPWNFHGASMEFHGVSMEFHGMPPRSSMKYWCSSMECHEIPWSFLGGPWNSMECHGVPWSTDGVPWNAIVCPWSSIEYHAVCMRKSIEIQ